MTVELDTILADVWEALFASAGNPASEWGLVALGTVDADGNPHQRLVILRGVDPVNRQLHCYTDRRSPKIEQIMLRPQTSWLFYDRQARVQVRLAGDARMRPHDDPMSRKAWQYCSPEHRRNYGGRLAPGTECSQGYGSAPEDLLANLPEIPESQAVSENFCVITVVIDVIDWLQVSESGNRRAQFWWAGEGWQSSWVAP